MLGMSRRGARTPAGPSPSPVLGRMTLCGAETALEPPHKDRWHRAISEEQLNTINNQFCRYYCRTHLSPVDKKTILSPPWTAGDDGDGDRWLMEHQGSSSTHTNAP